RDTAGEVNALYDAARAAYPAASVFRDRSNALIETVKDTENVLVMLSENYCKEFHTLIELVHAMRAGIHIVTVRVTRPGKKSFDLERISRALTSLEGVWALLDATGWAILAQNHVSETDVQDA